MIKLLLHPIALRAYFSQTIDVAQAELAACFPEAQVTLETHPTLTFLCTDLGEDAAPALSRLSFVQAIFRQDPGGLHLLDADPGFELPEELVCMKYRGKTHERVTQLAVNLAIGACRAPEGRGFRLLDPMAGRGTTLLFAARYGLSAVGIEKDSDVLEHLKRDIKRQTKLHRLKHQENKGFVGRKNKAGIGKFLEYRFGECGFKLIVGDSRNAVELLREQKFHMLVTDLPYGVHHGGRGRERNPTGVISECAPGWAESLRPGGVMVLIYNRLQTPRDALVEMFSDAGMEALEFEAPHRVSESIDRDLLVLMRPES